MKSRLLVLGAAQHAKVIVSALREFHADDYEVLGFLDDKPDLQGRTLLSLPILGTLQDLAEAVKNHSVSAVAIGVSNRFMAVRERLFNEAVAMDLDVPNIVHKRAYISPDAAIGRGNVINPGVIVNAFAKLADNCVCYSNATIEHETQLSSNVYIGPGVNFSSNARVGPNTFIGAGSRIIPDIQIGAGVIIGAGTVVIEDLPDGCTAVGVPARIIERSDAPFHTGK